MRKSISTIFGVIANYRFPTTIQKYINKMYVKFFDIDMSNFNDIKYYKTLNKLFTRKLIKIPEFKYDTKSMISPCDGLVLETGVAKNFKALSIKDRFYNIDELLGIDKKDFKEMEFDYINIYLSPKDYHHYHAPCDLEVVEADYFCANLYSVSVKTLQKVQNLYAKNERVVLTCRNLQNNKIFWLVFVGAINVGKMNFDFDPSIQTNANAKQNIKYKYNNVFLKQGEHIGNFELGSTILIISPKGLIKIMPILNNKIKFTDKIADIL